MSLNVEFERLSYLITLRVVVVVDVVSAVMTDRCELHSFIVTSDKCLMYATFRRICVIPTRMQNYGLSTVIYGDELVKVSSSSNDCLVGLSLYSSCLT